MPESQPNPDPETASATRRGIRWDAMAAIIASFVGLLALVVAGYTAYIERQQVQAQVWPYLQMGNSNALGHFEIVAGNKGVGPLIVRSVQVSASGKPIRDWHALEVLFGFKPTAGHIVLSTLNRTVLAPGEIRHWIAFQNQQDIEAFWADWKRFHVVAQICYVSTLGDSWMVKYGPGHSHTPRAVDRCPAVPDSRQFRD